LIGLRFLWSMPRRSTSSLRMGSSSTLILTKRTSSLQEFFRVLKPGGTLWFNFDNFMSPGGLAWFRDRPPAVGKRRIFRFYHPEFMKQMAEMRGFDDVTIATGEGRFAFLDARKPRQ
jgi:hypothetical protein